MLNFRSSVWFMFKLSEFLIMIFLELALLRRDNTNFIHWNFSRLRYWRWDVCLVFFALIQRYLLMLLRVLLLLLLLLQTRAHILSWKAIAFFWLIFVSKISGGVYLLLCLWMGIVLRFQSSLLQNVLICFRFIALDFSS